MNLNRKEPIPGHIIKVNMHKENYQISSIWLFNLNINYLKANISTEVNHYFFIFMLQFINYLKNDLYAFTNSISYFTRVHPWLPK